MKILLSVIFCVVLIQIQAFSADTNLPATLAELDHWYVNPPPNENAASNYLQAFAAMKIDPADFESENLPYIGGAVMPHASQPIPLAMQKAVAEFVERNRPALELLEKAAAFKQCRYPIDLLQGQNVPLSHLSKVKNAAKLLELASLFEALHGNGSQAGNYILAGLAASQSLGEEPVLISQLVRNASDSTIVIGLEQILNRISIPSTTLDKMGKTLEQIAGNEATGRSFVRAVAGEKVMSLAFFNMPPEQMVKQMKFFNDLGMPMTLNTNLLQPDAQFMAESFDHALQNLNLDYPQRLQIQDYLNNRANEADKRQFLLSSMLFPAIAKAVSRDAGDLTYLRLAQTAVALERYRNANQGHYPDSLQELTPNFLTMIPIDPFDGQPLRYHRHDSGYLMYSIGEDRKDNGGVRLKGGKGDLVFSVSNPPPLAQ